VFSAAAAAARPPPPRPARTMHGHERSLAWLGGVEPTTEDGASWALVGRQLGWSLFAQAVGVIVCGAPFSTRSVSRLRAAVRD
jgi:hypothetical protein